MPTPQEVEQAISGVHDQASFIQALLIDCLHWPVGEEAESLDDISYGWSSEELRAEGLDRHVVDGRIFQIQPLRAGQPWGVFLLEFTSDAAFTTGRGMTGPLRRVLRGLVPKRRAGPDHPSWRRENLLFICTHDYKHFRFGYFKVPPEGVKTAPLATFGWGPDIPARTVCEFNLPELAWPLGVVAADEWTGKWAAAFDVEKVTRRFYEDYREVFEKVEAIIAGLGDLKKPEDVRLFTQTLFNRLMFLRFVERKGWLVFQGHRDYLRALGAAGGTGGKSLYRSRIRRLFFEGLAIEKNPAGDAIGNVPFLNGGLFEKGELDAKIKDIPDEVFARIIGRDGLFYRYNFTVEESTPLDIEVAVDPEMLGKVFEELVTGRHETGSYYTPRPVVSFMCREALKGYLAERTKAKPDAIAALVDEHEVKGVTVSDARQVLEALDDLKAVDPACGSGAYLLGLLHELAAIYRLLYSERLAKDSRSLFELKLRIITRNLYGVDLDPFATNIAMLRLWLSLIVEFDGPTPPPLPNLDFKIETGDSVLGPSPRYYQHDLLGLQTSAEALVGLKEEFLREHGKRKDQLRTLIAEKEKELREVLIERLRPGVIDWRIQFAEVMLRQGKEGFDIVLANPPYVRQELIKDIKPELRKVYPKFYCGTADLYCYFYYRAVEVLRPGGMLVFISSNKWFRASYGAKLRSLFATKSRIMSITDFKDQPVFQTATAYPMIFVAQKAAPEGKTVLTEVRHLEPPYPDVLALVRAVGQFLPDGAIRGNVWKLAETESIRAFQKMEEAGPRLMEYVGGRMFYGIKTGFNDAFVIDSSTRAELLARDSKCREIIKPLLMGRDISRWFANSGGRWMIVTPIGVDMKRYPAVFAHLKKWQKELERRQDQGKHWWELRACSYYDSFSLPKIVYPDIAKEPCFAFDRSGAYMGNTGYIMPLEDLYLLGVLNSKPVGTYYIELSSQVRGGYVRFIRQYVEQIPIPNASPSDQATIIKLVQKCLDAKGKGCEAWEKEIDERVASLYGL